MHNYRDRLYILIHMTDNNHFDPIFLFTMIFSAVSDVSIYNSPSALHQPAVMEEVCSLQEFDRIILLINSSPSLPTFL